MGTDKQNIFEDDRVRTPRFLLVLNRSGRLYRSSSWMEVEEESAFDRRGIPYGSNLHKESETDTTIT